MLQESKREEEKSEILLPYLHNRIHLSCINVIPESSSCACTWYQYL